MTAPPKFKRSSSSSGLTGHTNDRHPTEELQMRKTMNYVATSTSVQLMLRQAQVYGRWLFDLWDHYGVDYRRVFIVGCQGCATIFVITAGPRGGGWRGRCPTCGRPAQRSASDKALEIMEIEKPEPGEQEPEEDT